VLPNVPRFLATIRVLPQTSVAPIFLSIYRYASFVGFVLAFVLYLALRRIAPDRRNLFPTGIVPARSLEP
jgi:cytosine/uracil/thiamine/allantoin permease